MTNLNQETSEDLQVILLIILSGTIFFILSFSLNK